MFTLYMKKDRNSFFNEQSYSYGYMPNNMAIGPNMMPSQASSFQQSFYSGPGYPTTGNTSIDSSDIEARLSKIERSIARLDSRITKLESTNIADTNIENTTNMYMV